MCIQRNRFTIYQQLKDVNRAFASFSYHSPNSKKNFFTTEKQEGNGEVFVELSN